MTAVLTVLGTGLAPAAAGPADRCPAAKTCPDFSLYKARWPAKASGPVVIPYLVNPGGQVTMTEQEVVGAVQAAMRVWQRANPRIAFRFDGVTSLPPGVPDGRNVIGFGVVRPPLVTAGAAAVISSEDGLIFEADLILNASQTWLWQECPQRDHACGAPQPVHAEVGSEFTGEITRLPAGDLQGVLTHELGHWLSLNHPDRQRGRQQTMFGTGFTLSSQTLALGDVLGVRAAYPCGACGGKPVVFAP